MTFKLRSEILIHQYPPGQHSIPHSVFSRDRLLRPGSVIKARGLVGRDVETKTGMYEGKAIITVLDNERLHISFRRDLTSALFNMYEDGYWEDLIIKGADSYGMQELGNVYHSVLRYTLPEIFTLLDRVRIPSLIRAKCRELGNDSTAVRRETEIVYEPLLPSQARK